MLGSPETAMLASRQACSRLKAMLSYVPCQDLQRTSDILLLRHYHAAGCLSLFNEASG